MDLLGMNPTQCMIKIFSSHHGIHRRKHHLTMCYPTLWGEHVFFEPWCPFSYFFTIWKVEGFYYETTKQGLKSCFMPDRLYRVKNVFKGVQGNNDFHVQATSSASLFDFSLPSVSIFMPSCQQQPWLEAVCFLVVCPSIHTSTSGVGNLYY